MISDQTRLLAHQLRLFGIHGHMERRATEALATQMHPLEFLRLLLEDSIIARHGKLPVAFESHQLVTVGRMVAEGLGVSAVPSLCREQMEELGARCHVGVLVPRDHDP